MDRQQKAAAALSSERFQMAMYVEGFRSAMANFRAAEQKSLATYLIFMAAIEPAPREMVEGDL